MQVTPSTDHRAVRQKVNGGYVGAVVNSQVLGGASSSLTSAASSNRWVTGRRGGPATIEYEDPNVDAAIDFDELEAEGACSPLLHRQ